MDIRQSTYVDRQTGSYWTEWDLQIPAVNLPTFTLELTSRQSGKTTRIVKAAVDYVTKNKGHAIIYTHSEQMAQRIRSMISPYRSHYDIMVLPFSQHHETLGRNLTTPLWLYDEFDYFKFPGDFTWPINVYAATTLKFVRDIWLKRDPVYKALKRTNGIFQCRVNPSHAGDWALSEMGGVYRDLGGFIYPDISIPSLSPAFTLATHKIHVD